MKQMLFKELVDGILSIFGHQVIRIVLYGSVARGTNTVESDIDIALLLNGGLSKITEDRLSDLVVDLNLKYDTVLSVIDIDYEIFRKWEKVIPFYKNMNEEGIIYGRKHSGFIKKSCADCNKSHIISSFYRKKGSPCGNPKHVSDILRFSAPRCLRKLNVHVHDILTVMTSKHFAYYYYIQKIKIST